MMTRFKSFLGALGTEMQACENAASQLGNNLNIHRATGVVLNEFGADIQLPRIGGEEDDEYRTRILEAWVLYRSNGAPDEMIDAAYFLTGASVVHLRENAAGQGIFLYLSVNSNVVGHAAAIREGKAAGVPIEVILAPEGAPTFPAFAGADSDMPESFTPDDSGWDGGLGFSELNCATPSAEIMLWDGGYIAELITY